MSKKLKILLGVVWGIILLPIIVSGIILTQLFNGSKPQTPTIKNGAFPFRLVYELDDGTKIYYSTDKPAYYMGDAKKSTYINDPFNGVFTVGPSRSQLHKMDLEDMLEHLNIVLIEWEIAPPIVNEFK